MRILLLMDNTSGVSFHRLYTPYVRLQQDYENVVVDVSQNPPGWINIDFENYDVVVFNRWLSVAQYNIFEKLDKLDIPTICDVDDYWVLPKSNPAYKVYKKMIGSVGWQARRGVSQGYTLRISNNCSAL